MSKTEVTGYINITIHNKERKTYHREEEDISAFIRIDNIIMVTESWRMPKDGEPTLTSIHINGNTLFTKETVEEVMEKIKTGNICKLSG